MLNKASDLIKLTTVFDINRLSAYYKYLNYSSFESFFKNFIYDHVTLT